MRSRRHGGGARVSTSVLRVLPGILRDLATRERSLVQPGAPVTARRERALAADLVAAYLALTGEHPTWSGTSETPFTRMGRAIFELAGLDGWEYHGRRACKARIQSELIGPI